MSGKTAAIFDLDGTILYTLKSIARAGNRMLGELGYAARPLAEYRMYCGEGADTLVRRVLRAAGGLTDENISAGKLLNRRFLSEEPDYGVQPYEGIPEALAALKAKGLKLAVLSNKPDDAAQAVIRKHFGALFDHVQGQTASVPLKPDPAGALIAAQCLGAKPEECLYVGDSGTDMKTGKAAGMYTVGVLWGYRDRQELLVNGADRLVASPDELAGLMDCGEFCVTPPEDKR